MLEQGTYGVNSPAWRQSARSRSYPRVAVGLLWFCGFLSYADRQALSSVPPILEQKFTRSDLKLGLLGSAFMLDCASTSQLAGFVVDRARRNIVIPAGLGFSSLICAATGLSRSFGQLVFFRAAAGLDESFYFPCRCQGPRL